jgi:hypothetical protein
MLEVFHLVEGGDAVAKLVTGDYKRITRMEPTALHQWALAFEAAFREAPPVRGAGGAGGARGASSPHLLTTPPGRSRGLGSSSAQSSPVSHMSPMTPLGTKHTIAVCGASRSLADAILMRLTVCLLSLSAF